MNVTEYEAQPTLRGTGDLPQKNSAEHEGYAGACNSTRIAENTAINATDQRLLEQILNRNNLNQAFERVKRNKGAAGVDKMEVGEMLKYLKANGEELSGKHLNS